MPRFSRRRLINGGRRRRRRAGFTLPSNPSPQDGTTQSTTGLGSSGQPMNLVTQESSSSFNPVQQPQAGFSGAWGALKSKLTGTKEDTPSPLPDSTSQFGQPQSTFSGGRRGRKSRRKSRKSRHRSRKSRGRRRRH